MANGQQTASAVITADAKPFKKSLDDAGKAFGGFSKAAQGFGLVAAAAFAAASVAALQFVTDSVKAAAKAEAISRGLQNAAENAGVFASQAGGIEGATKALSDYAEQLGIAIGKDDEQLLQIVSGWLAVPDLAALGVDGLENLLTVAADVAAGTGKDLNSIADAFKKVAGDGETALSKLLRQGIVFTDEQKNVYESLLASNDEIGAQQYLIDTLGDKYSGAAEAIADPFDQISELFANFSEDIGYKLLPALDDLLPQLQAVLDELVASPEFNRFLEDLVEQFKELAPQLLDIVPNMLDLAEVAIPVLIDILPDLVDIVGDLATIFDDTTASVQGLNDWFEFFMTPLELLIETIALLASGFENVGDKIQFVIDKWNALFDLNIGGYDIGGAAFGGNWTGGSPDSIDRGLTRSLSMGVEGKATYNISVNAIAPTAEVGRVVVDSIKSYRRVGGVF